MGPMTEDALVARRSTKDTVFTDLFRDPRYLLQLYRCLHPEDTETKEADLAEVTRKGILTNSMYNDLGFLVKDRLIILVEAQSTWSENIILRGLMYLVQTYQDHLNRKGQEQSIYSSTKVTLPKPELYVLYTGKRKQRKEVLTLSESFFGGQDCALEVRVRVIYDGVQGDIIHQYVTFTDIFSQQVKQYGRTRQAVAETIRICQDSDVLKDYLEERKKEVVSIMMSLFDEETILRSFLASERRRAQSEGRQDGHQKGLQEGRQKGLQEGRQKGLQEGLLVSLQNLISNTGMPPAQAMSMLSIPEEDRPRYAAMLEQ